MGYSRSEASSRSNIISAVATLHEISGEMPFTAKEIHELIDGKRSTISATLGDMAREGVLERVELGKYVCRDIDRVKRYTGEGKNKRLAEAKARTRATGKEGPTDTGTTPTLVPAPIFSMAEAKAHVDWVFNTYIPYLEETVKSQQESINHWASIAKKAKIYHQERREEQ